MIEAQLLLKNKDATLENIVTMASLIIKAFPKTNFEISGCAKTGIEPDSFYVMYRIKYEKEKFFITYSDGKIPFMDSCSFNDIDTFLIAFQERFTNGTL